MDSAAASSAMLEAMGAHEYYCASYAGKEQPHIEGLLVTLADALRAKEKDLALAKEAGENVDGHRVARGILHRLKSGMNRRMHKGFPEMLTYLLRRPMEYCSHEFVHVVIHGHIRFWFREMYGLLGKPTNTTRQSGKEVADAMRVSVKPYLACCDYPFRPERLEHFPMYFFFAGCRVVKQLGRESLDWMVCGQSRQRSYCQEPLMSTAFPALHLMDEARRPLHKYEWYVGLWTQEAWRVPVLHGKLPPVATDASTPEEKRNYALIMMMLFRPHRSYGQDILAKADLREDVSEDVAFGLLWGEFVKWRAGIYETAKPYFERSGSAPPKRVEFESAEWWACVIYERLRNYEAAKQAHHHQSSNDPGNLTHLPEYGGQWKHGSDIEEEEEAAGPQEAPDSEADGLECPQRHGDEGDLDNLPPKRAGKTVPLAVHCGELPSGSRLEDFHDPPAKVHRRNAEGIYWKHFVDSVGKLSFTAEMAEVNVATVGGWDIPSDDATHALEKQKQFFKSVDSFRAEPTSRREAPKPHRDPYQQRIARSVASLQEAVGPNICPSETVVMEAAFHLIQAGLLDVPDIRKVNVKQTRAFLWNAAWLQEYMLTRWRESGEFVAEAGKHPHMSADDFHLAIVGPGGTGKTAVLKLTEALIVFFLGPDTVQKLAPSNAAARLLGGDTLHSLCKLPFGDARLTSKKGRLSKEVLRGLRQKWNTTVAAFLDEISMVPADAFLQMDVRLRQAKMRADKTFGNLAMIVCGDFLQLPPVNKSGLRPSLAKPIDDLGKMIADDEEDVAEVELKKEAHVEARQGFDLWRSVRRVVCLDVNVRAPDGLGRLQAEMRAGKVSDEMWRLYQDSVVKPNDPRLVAPGSPFVEHETHFIVHRHRIRVQRSLAHAKEQSQKQRTPLYMVQAFDEVVRPEDASKFTPRVQAELLQKVSPDHTKGLPSFLPLYRGMRLLLSSKDCVRFGIVKGCECILRDIVFADREALPFDHIAGEAHPLRYMPVSLILQASDAQWTLPATELPESLPASLDKRGLFQLRPSYDYLSAKVEDEYIRVRRTCFSATPADTITVYAAQGGTFHAVIADMHRPPSENFAKHWLACYVMMSRARSMDGFLVLRPATRAELETRPPQYLLDELQRLHEADELSCTLHGAQLIS